MKALSKTESRRLERMWNAESGAEKQAKAKAEETVQEVIRHAEEKYQRSLAEAAASNTKAT